MNDKSRKAIATSDCWALMRGHQEVGIVTGIMAQLPALSSLTASLDYSPVAAPVAAATGRVLS